MGLFMIRSIRSSHLEILELNAHTHTKIELHLEASSSPGFFCAVQLHPDGSNFTMPKTKVKWLWGKDHGVTL